MGGSGGGGYFNGDAETVQRQWQVAREATESAEYQAEVNGFLGQLLTRFNDRNTEAIATHLAEIKRALDRDIDGTVDLRFGGSVAKHTYVDGLSDVDALVFLDNCELAERAPGLAKDYLADRLIERFPGTEIVEGGLAVTVKFADSDIQLLPAVTCRDRVQIPDAAGEEWAEINPRGFAGKLTEMNDRLGKKLVPVVKLAKALIGELPEQQRISGYHAEAIGIDAFRAYDGPLTPKAMLSHYFARASERVLDPISDVTGQSLHVDEYLGPRHTIERRIVSDAFARIARRMERADRSGRTEEWRGLFGET